MRLLFSRKLNRKERDALHHMIDKKMGNKPLIIALSYEGHTVREIARKLNTHPVTVRRWIRSFNKEGLRCLYRRAGRKKQTDGRVKKKILRIALTKPTKIGLPFSTWSTRKLKFYVKRRLKIDISHEQIRRILLSYGLNPRKSRRKLISDDPEYDVKMARIKRLLKKPNCIVMFEDEKVIVAKEYSGYEWCFKARIVKANQKIKGKAYIFGFLDPHKMRFYHRYYENVTKKNFMDALKWISKKIKDILYIILDSSTAHPVPTIKKDMESLPKDVRLVFLPKHSPKDNRVEDINSLIQREVLDNRRFSNIEEVKRDIDKWIRAFNRKNTVLVDN